MEQVPDWSTFEDQAQVGITLSECTCIVLHLELVSMHCEAGCSAEACQMPLTSAIVMQRDHVWGSGGEGVQVDAAEANRKYSKETKSAAILASLQSTGAQGTESQEQVRHENAIPGPKTSLLRPTRATM